MAIVQDAGLSAAGDGQSLGRFTNHWFVGTLLAGKASAPQLRAFGVALAGLYDHLPRLFGPPVMTGPDYKIRRLVVDQLLTTVDLPDGTSVRVGEGGHAALAQVLARAFGASDTELEGAAYEPRLVAAADQLVATMFEPPAWASMAAVAQSEFGVRADLSALRDTLRDVYKVDASALAIFDAPSLYPSSVREGATDHLQTAFDAALFSYYQDRIHGEWHECWNRCFDAAAGA